MILDATTKSIEIILAGAITTNQLPVVSSWADITTTAFTPGETDTLTNGVTAVTIVAAPAASTQRQVKEILVYNADTVAATVRIRYNNNTTIRQLTNTTLQTGETLVYREGMGWMVLDVSGKVKINSASAPSDIVFSATDKLLGRATAGAGTGEEIALTSAGWALIDDADAAAQRTTLGLGSVGLLSVDNVLPWTIAINVFATAKSNVNWDTLGINASAIFNGFKQSSGAQNDSIAWDVVLAAGTWAVELIFNYEAAQGVYSIQFDSVEKGTIDAYGGALVWNARASITGIVVPTTAKIELKLKMATKNGLSTNYYGTIMGVRLIRTV